MNGQKVSWSVGSSSSMQPLADRPDPSGLRALIPSYGGLKMTRAALYEYAGIAHYLVAGHIDLEDLGSETP